MQENISEEDLQNVGELLRNTRIKQGKTLQNAADELCIRRFYLDAIENMDYKNFPPMPYSIGFIRCYAQYLGLNEDRIVLTYKKTAFPELVDEKAHSGMAILKSEKTTSAPKIWHIILGLVGLAALIFIWSQYFTFSDTAKEEITEDVEEDVIAEPEIIEDEENSSEASATEEVKEQNNSSSASVEDNADKQKIAETTTADTESLEENKSRIKIVLTGPSWIELKQNGKILLTGIYQRGYSYEIPYGNNTVISVGKPRSVQFYIDGKLTRVATAAKPRNILLDKFLQNKN